jgi:hypothetical protein
MTATQPPPTGWPAGKDVCGIWFLALRDKSERQPTA